MIQNISIGFSPCPNDTFMFCAMVSNMIEPNDFSFNPVIEDVEKLNRKALNGELDITKLSLPAYAAAAKHYRILNSGSAFGKGCGPLLISKKKYSVTDIENLKIAIPGKYTTANLLLSIFFPNATNKIEMVFSEIEDTLLNETDDAGLIIHENRFTYQQKGLQKIADIGEIWEQETSSPLPLGIIAVKRNFNIVVQKKLDVIINDSIRYAFEKPEKVLPYVRTYAQEMDENVMLQHIRLYVNDFSLDLGTEGKKAIELLLKRGNEAGLLPEISGDIFI